jgi:hypothetical protein
MRAIWIALPLALAVLTPQNGLIAQSRDAKARQAQARADSIRLAREQVADSIRRRNPNRTPNTPANTARARDSVARAAARTANRPESVPPTAVTPVAPEVVSPPPAAVPANTPVPGRTRALLRRLRDQPDSPSFCRSGAGHPVYGRDWCWERGFRLGDDWERDRARELSLQAPTRRPIDQTLLSEMLGTPLLERLEAIRIGLRLTDPLTGSYAESPLSGRILHVRAGTTIIAELSDRNRDGRAEVLWLRKIQ